MLTPFFMWYQAQEYPPPISNAGNRSSPISIALSRNNVSPVMAKMERNPPMYKITVFLT